VYWFDASRQSKRISANVSGMFGTTRISLNDNLLKRSSPDEVKAVLGHEMGHYVLNHVYKGIVFFGIIIVLAFAFVRCGVSAGPNAAGAIAGNCAVSATWPGCRCSRHCSPFSCS
jgi:STE24 endopeptidase